MSATIQYDEEPARRILELSDTEDMQAQRRRVVDLLAPEPGWRILDVGCGPGHLAAQLAQAVGPSGHVDGVDVSEHMLALAAPGDAELLHLSGDVLPFEDATFDAAVSTQVFEYIEDLPTTLRELWRVTRDGARIVILDTDWQTLVWHSTDPARMERVLDGWRARLADPYLPRTLPRLLREAGFELTRCEAHTILDLRGEEGSYSVRQIEHLGASAAGVSGGEVAAWAEDLRGLAADGRYFFSLNRYLFLASKPER